MIADRTHQAKKTTVVIDLIVMAVLAVVVWAASVTFNVFDHLATFIQRYEEWDIDEFFVVGIFLTFALTVFSVRRWREIRRLLAERECSMDALRAAKESAEAASKAKGEFLANMSHEIRTPMNGIIGMTDLTLDTALDEEQREYLGMVKSSADALLQVLNDVLDFSKVEAGKLELNPAPFSLRTYLGDVLKTLGLRAAEKGLELTQRIAADVPDSLIGDSLRLRQVVVNLVGNAIKFTEHGEVVLEVVAENRFENFAVLHFTVSDTGIGIPAEKQQVIFEAFMQGDATPSRRYGGTGLGLAISKQLVELMQGRIWAESEPGHGSTFHFTMRFEIGAWEAAQPPLLNIEVRGVRALIVDDNAVNRRILEELISGWSMRPVTAAAGPAAITAMEQAVAEHDPFVLVLLDAMMPGMDGFAVAEKIRARPELAQATIMMLSSADSGGDSARCRAVGIRNYLRKPVASPELYGAIMVALSDQGHGAGEKPAAGAIENRAAANNPRHARSVLLVEDNAVNRCVAAGLLKKRGFVVEAVENGKQALEALACERFDLVLMDVQMPEMDGFETTDAIRRQERSTGEHVPIVAMTAHAMQGDRERCLQAGMDDYVSKPIEPLQLFATLERFLPRDEVGELNDSTGDVRNAQTACRASDASEASPADASTNAGEPLDVPALRARVESDLDLLEEMIKLFFSSSPALLAEIETAVVQRDCQTVARAAHCLKGALLNMCAGPCSNAAIELEQAGRKGDLAQINESLQTLRAELQRLLSELTDVEKEIGVEKRRRTGNRNAHPLVQTVG